MSNHILKGGWLAAPPGRHGGQQQALAKQTLRDFRQKSDKCRRLQHASAQSIRQSDTPGAHGSEQSGDPQCGVAPQFHRVAVVIVEATQNGMDALQSRQCLQIDRIVAHGQVRTLR